MTKCKNCGHDSHCGNPLWKSVEQKSEYDDGHREMEQIEVCKHCRCEKCTTPDWGQKGERKMVGTDCDNILCINVACTCDPCECTVENPCVCCEDHQVTGPKVP